MSDAIPIAPRTPPPAVLARWIDDLDRAAGWAAAAPFGKLTLFAVAPAMAVGWAMVHVQRGPESPALPVSPFIAVPLFLVFQSALAVVLMRFLLWLLGRYIHEPLGLIIVGAFLWGTVNANSPTWGTHVVWPFYVMAAVFLRLQARSLNRAYAIAILMHALFSLVTCAPELRDIFFG